MSRFRGILLHLFDLFTRIYFSIRVPAAHCGLYGFKPSVARMPHAGLEGSHDGMDNIVGVVGPLTRSARDLALFCKVMLDSESWLKEHAVLQIPWKQDVVDGVGLPEKLTIAILADDGVFRPHPPLLHALDQHRKVRKPADSGGILHGLTAPHIVRLSRLRVTR